MFSTYSKKREKHAKNGKMTCKNRKTQNNEKIMPGGCRIGPMHPK